MERGVNAEMLAREAAAGSTFTAAPRELGRKMMAEAGRRIANGHTRQRPQGAAQAARSGKIGAKKGRMSAAMPVAQTQVDD